MSRYEHNDVCFDVPRDWKDRSVVAFAAPMKVGQGKSANLVMTRDELRSAENLQAYIDRQVVELKSRLENFRMHERVERTLGGLPATELRFGWHGQGGALEQRLVFVGDQRRGVLTFTATMPKTEAGRLNPLFDRILASVTFPDIQPTG
jgi:hypothetical protein